MPSIGAIIILAVLSFNQIIFTKKIAKDETAEKKAPEDKKQIIVDLNKEIVFGQSYNESGSLKIYGSTIKNGINAYFKRINDEQGGIHGKKLRLVSLQDQGNPLITENNIRKLRSLGINMFLGNMGTRSVLKVLDQIANKKILMLFPWAGNEKLRDSNLKYIINGPGFLSPQLRAITNSIVMNIKHTKVAIFHADDDFSNNATEELVTILGTNNIHPIAITSYNRLTLDLAASAQALIESDPKIVICIGTSTPTARLINKFFERGHYDTIFMGIDSTMFTSDVLKDKGVQFYYSSSVPNPTKSTFELAQQYRKDLAQYFPYESPNILSFTYYICAAIVVEALKKIEGPITPDTIVKQIEQMQHYNIKGFTVEFDAHDRHAFGKTISIIKGK